MSEPPQNILVIGGSGGLGEAMVRQLLLHFPVANVFATHHRSEPPFQQERLHWQPLDLLDPKAIENWAAEFETVDWLVNCAGYLHGDKGGPEKNIAAIDSNFFLHNIQINTLPTLLLAKYFARSMKNSPAAVLATISAKVGSIEVGGWYSYRIAKAALNMALKTLSIEWKHSHPRGCVAALHPGTNDTALSKPFQARVAPDDLFQPDYTATMLIKLLSQLNASQSGHFWAWDGELLTW